VIGKHKYKNSRFGVKDLRYFVERGYISIKETEVEEEKGDEELEEEEEGGGTGTEEREEREEEAKEEEEEEEDAEEEEELNTAGISNTARINNTGKTQGKTRRIIKYKIPLRPLPPNVRYGQIARDTQGPLTEQEQTQLNRLRGGLPSLITRVRQQGKMNDENKARIALIKARI